MNPAKAARIGTKYGVPYWTGYKIARYAKRTGVGLSLAFALVEQESGFRHIFGHDYGGPFPGLAVTRSRYRKLVAHIKRGGYSNGVGFLQITYPVYLIEHPGLWRKRANLKFGLAVIKNYIKVYGERKGLGAYNGGPSNPQWDYADLVIWRKRRWQRRFS